MRVIRTPSVYLVGSQNTNDAEIERFLADHDVSSWDTDTSIGGEKLAEIAGRVCYMSFAKPRPGGAQAYLERILESAHGSVLEHAVFNFIITGVSRSFTHELVRHRAGFGYSQLSQRYVDESVADFVEPDCIADDPELHAIWLSAIEECQAAYVKLVAGLSRRFAAEPVPPAEPAPPAVSTCGAPVEPDKTQRRKLARQAARSVLPNATETKIFVTGNARAWRHFIEMRASEHAETEIRKVALLILERLQEAAPRLFGDYQVIALSAGVRVARTPHRKV